MGKGSNTTESTTAPNWQAMQQYSNLLNRAANVASTPYQAYGGEEVAPINQQQQLGIGNINANAGFANPYVQGGANMISASGQPISAADIQRYMSPYTNDVVNATQADFDHSNAVAQSQVTGNAAAQNALGGNRVGVAQSLTAQGNARAQAPIIAGLRNTGFQTALGAAQNQQRTGLQAGSQYGQMGIAGQQAGLAGAGAQIGAGTLEQQTQQAQDTAAKLKYWQEQGFPYQQAQWLAGVSTGVGSQMGGQSSTQGPTPNPWTQAAGVALAAAPLLLQRGGRVSGFAPPRRNRAQGGYNGPWAGAEGWVPGMSITPGKGPPAPPQAAKEQGLSNQQLGKGLAGAGRGIGDFYYDNYAGGSYDSPLPGLTPGEDYDPAGPGVRAHGGRVGYATRGSVWDEGDEPFRDYVPPTMGGVGGSSPSFDDRFDASYPALKRVEPMQAPQDEGPVPMPRSRPEEADVFTPPGGPYRPTDPAAMQGFRNRVDQDHGGEPPPSPEAGPPPPEAGFWPPTPEDAPDRAMALADEPTPPPGVRAINRADRGALPPNAQPTAGVGFPPPPMQTAPELQGEQSFLEKLGIRMTPSLRQGLMQAGLAMMSTHRGGPGSFLGGIGEGGQAGVAAYNQSENLAQRQAVEQQKMARDDYWKQRPYDEMTALQKWNAAHANDMTDFQKETLKRQALDEAIKLRTPIKMGESVSGRPIMALPQIKNGKVELYPMNQDGSVSATPITPGGSIKAPPAASPNTSQPPPQTTDSSAPTKADEPAPPASPQARDEKFLADVAKEDQGYAEAVKKAADYELDPGKYASMRQGNRQKFINDVLQYDRSYDTRTYAMRTQAMKAFLPGMKLGDSTRSFNTAIAHLDTLKGLYEALQNGDRPAYNRFANTFKTQFLGQEAPNNVAAAAQLVGGEIVKAVVGSQNALGDREEVRQSISRDLSKGQALGVIRTYTDLMAGQLRSIRKAYEADTGLHNFDSKYLFPETQKAMSGISIRLVPLAGEVREFKGEKWRFKGNGSDLDQKNWVKVTP